MWRKVKGIANSYNKPENSHEFNAEAEKAVLNAVEELCPPWSEAPPPDLSNVALVELFEMPFDISELEAVINSPDNTV